MTPTAKRLLRDFQDAAESLGHWQAKDGALGSPNLTAAAISYAKGKAALAKYLERREAERRRLRKRVTELEGFGGPKP